MVQQCIKSLMVIFSLWSAYSVAAGEAHPAKHDVWQRAQSVHREHKTRCADLELFTQQGLTLTPAQEKERVQCKRQNKEGAPAAKSVTDKGIWKGYGVMVTRNADQVYVNGKPASLIEKTPQAAVYEQGINQVIFYNSGKVALQTDSRFTGYLK